MGSAFHMYFVLGLEHDYWKTLNGYDSNLEPEENAVIMFTVINSNGGEWLSEWRGLGWPSGGRAVRGLRLQWSH